MAISIRILGRGDADVLARLESGVFDGPITDELIHQFLGDPRHHIAVAIDDTSTVVGMASALHYVHPDKPPQLFINEVGVADSHRRSGIGLLLMNALLGHGSGIGCGEAWVATEEENAAARALFLKAGGEQAEQTIVMYTFDLADHGAGDGPIDRS